MFGDYVYKRTSAEFTSRMLLVDEDDLQEKTHYIDTFMENGFQVISYDDDLHFRIQWEEKFKGADGKYVILAHQGDYIPYDIQKVCGDFRNTVSLANLFPKLSALCLQERNDLNFDLLCTAYKNVYEDLTSYFGTQQFISNTVYGRDNVEEYLGILTGELQKKTDGANNYKDWMLIAEKKAAGDVLAAENAVDFDTSFINEPFQNFVLGEYGKLSSKLDNKSPVLVKGAMDYMKAHSDRFVIIVMDGMSEFDWEIMARSFHGIHYERSAAMAMIPTITSLSRQSLVSGKFPKQLISPWRTSKEEKEFTDCAIQLGYRKEQIGYYRGYDADVSALIQCGVIIINDIDDIVHGQKQGRKGMYHDIGLLAESGKLVDLVRRLLKQGFDVYISADHGNTECVGQGRLMKLGVETETKSHRMLVLQKFADKEQMIQKYDLIEFPKYYLDKNYDYLICKADKSFDASGEKVMTHGGVTLDEVVVPFIKIKAVDNNE